MKKSILFVDEEIKLLERLKRSLRGLSGEWDMEFVLTGDEALEKASKTPYDIVVSDYKMPGMNGIELLEKVKETRPAAIRVLLSGQSEAGVAEKAKPLVDRYLEKPCDVREIIDLMKSV